MVWDLFWDKTSTLLIKYSCIFLFLQQKKKLKRRLKRNLDLRSVVNIFIEEVHDQIQSETCVKLWNHVTLCYIHT